MEVLIDVEKGLQLPCHFKHGIDLFHEIPRVFFVEAIVISLQHEVLIDLRTLGQEETTDLLNLGIFGEELLVFCLSSMLGVISHQEFCEENAGIETLSD